jgi:hypothetical protein
VLIGSTAPPPAAGDQVDIGVTTGQPYTVTFDPAFASLLDLFVTSSDATLALPAGAFLQVTTSASLDAGTVDIGSGALFTVQNNLLMGSGSTINLAEGHLNVSSGVITDNGLIEGGTGNSQITGSNGSTIAGAGTVVAAGGTLDVSIIVTGTGLSFDVTNDASSLLQMDGTAVAVGNTFTLQGPAGAVGFSPAGLSENIVGLNVGPVAASTNFINVAGTVTINPGSETGTGDSGSIALDNGDTFTLTGITDNGGGLNAGTWHAIATADASLGGTDIFLSAVCYAAGTHILTAAGERAIEELLQGDIVLTLSDGELTAQPVKWVGHRRINLTAHPRPETVAPVRIERDAFADNMPHRDLVVSPDHAIFVDGKLICARQLVNGTTIRQELDWTAVDYYHVDLDQHAILMAEALPAESYIDTGNSGFFANSEAPLVLHPDLTDETDYPTREAGSCAPFVWDEASVQPVWQRLADRAAAIGRPVPQRVTTTDAGLRLLAGRRSIKPIFINSDLLIFVLPRGAREVGLVSHAQSPTEARPWLEDRRRLGVRIKRIVLRC